MTRYRPSPTSSITMTKGPSSVNQNAPMTAQTTSSQNPLTPKSPLNTKHIPRWALPSVDVPKAEYPQIGTAPVPTEPAQIQTIATEGLEQLNSILQKNTYSQLSDLLLPSGAWWKDHLGLSQQFRTLSGAQDIESFIEEQGGSAIRKFALDGEARSSYLDPAGTIACIQSLITFESELGAGRGMIRQVQDADDGDKWKIITIFTTLRELKGYPENGGYNRPLFGKPDSASKELNWKEYRDEQREFKDESPTVLIVGAGHCGLVTAARLGMLGIKSLVIDRQARTGDSWRQRYHHLQLHDPCYMNVLPYLSYPPGWPIYASKDKLAGFLESYAEILDLNVWNSTELVNSVWSDSEKQWTVSLNRTVDGVTTRHIMTPKHLIQATGLNGEARLPDIPGIQDFKGDRLVHSSNFPGATDAHRGKKIIVVGTGNSGHDIAQDFCQHGAHVTMVQRSSTCVITLSSVRKLVGALYREGFDSEEGDLLGNSLPRVLSKHISADVTAMMAQVDKATVDALAAVGFKCTSGPEGAGVNYLSPFRNGGYYIDIGASALIGSGAISIKQGQNISAITPHGMVFTDDTELPADEIIFATGYANVNTRTRKIFGDSVADNIGPVWGLDEEGESRGIWIRSGHPGFWVAAGNLMVARYYSRLLALQIKAIEEGLVPL